MNCWLGERFEWFLLQTFVANKAGQLLRDDVVEIVIYMYTGFGWTPGANHGNKSGFLAPTHFGVICGMVNRIPRKTYTWSVKNNYRGPDDHGSWWHFRVGPELPQFGPILLMETQWRTVFGVLCIHSVPNWKGGPLWRNTFWITREDHFHQIWVFDTTDFV